MTNAPFHDMNATLSPGVALRKDRRYAGLGTSIPDFRLDCRRARLLRIGRPGDVDRQSPVCSVSDFHAHFVCPGPSRAACVIWSEPYRPRHPLDTFAIFDSFAEIPYEFPILPALRGRTASSSRVG